MIFYRMIRIKWQTWNVNWVCFVSGHVSPPRPGAGSGIEASDVRRLGNVICGILMHGPSPGSSDHWTPCGQPRGDLPTPGHSGHSAPGISHWLHKLNAWISPPSSIHIISAIIIIVPFQGWIECWMEAWRRSEAGAPGFLWFGLALYPMCTLVTSRSMENISISDPPASEVWHQDACLITNHFVKSPSHFKMEQVSLTFHN